MLEAALPKMAASVAQFCVLIPTRAWSHPDFDQAANEVSIRDCRPEYLV